MIKAFIAGSRFAHVLAMFMLSATASYAVTPPALNIFDTAGNVVTVDTTGTVTFSGNASCIAGITCSTYTVTVQPGKVAWTGSIGSFTVSSEVGLTKPTLAPPSMDLNLQQLTTSMGGSLTIQWTDINFTAVGGTTGTLVAGGTISGSGSVSYSAYMDNSNVPFGQGIPIGLLGPFTSSSFGGAVTGPGSTSSPFSMTQSVTVTMGASTTAGGDFHLSATPNCSGTIGDFVWNDLNGNGIQDAGEPGLNGVTVQLYKGAVLPANLIATTVTGLAPATYTPAPPGANGAGYYQFTGVCQGSYNVVVDSAQPALSGYLTSPSFQGGNPVTDSNGSPAAVTLPTDSSTDETIDFGFTAAPPPALTCGASTGQVGVLYTSSLNATGGFTPYTFSGTGLPPWLTLVSATGALSGIPTTPGPISFIATVVDARNNAAGTATASCTIVINPPPTATCVTIVAVQGFPITPVTMTGSGGAGGPYTFTSSDLTSQTGLMLSSSGTIAGTPTVSGTFSYTVTVTDKAGNTGTFSCSVTINPPPSASCVTINAVQGVPITSVTMTGSGGAGGPYTFSSSDLTSQTGLTLSSNGTISGTPTVSGTFTYHVTVTDKAGNTGTFSCSVTINPPPSASCVTINAVQGVPITSVTMTGSGGAGGPYTFSSSDLTSQTGLTLSSNGTISGTPTVSGTFTYHVTVTDKAGNTGTFSCSVTINPPPSASCVTINAVQGVPITSVTMTGSGGAGGPYTFSSSDLTSQTGLTLSSSGTISGTPTVSGTFTYHVTVTDKAGNTGTFSCSVTINPPPSASCVTINAVQGVPITSVTMTGSGGAGGPYTFSSSDLTSQTGLTLSSNGTISGTPTVSGTFTYHVTVTDKAGNTGTFSCSVTINPPPSASCVTINAVQGVPITSVTMTGSGGAGGPYTFSSSDLTSQTGLTLSSSGTISGTPTVSGTFTYHVTVTDKAGNTGTFSCSVTINPPPSASCVTINAVQGVPITSVTMTGSGGAGGPYTFSSSDLTSQTGLTLSSSGTISGTPTVSGTFTYHVTVTDKAGNTGTFSCSVTINPPPSASCVTINAVQGVPITSVTMTGSGGAGGPYTFSSSDLTSQTGLTLSSNGTISGTPTVSGTFTYHVTVTDKAGNTGTFSCSVTINPPPSASCVTINAVQGVPITSVTMTGSGGAGGPYTFSSSDLTSQTGLTLSSSGTISGTPTVSGTFTYHVTVTDKAGNTGTFSCSVTINPPPSASCVTINAVQGVPITSVTMTGSGGAGGPYTFSSSDLTSQTGLTLSSSGTISGTPTVTGTFTYHVTVTDKNGNKGTFNCSVTVQGLPVLACSAFSIGESGVPFDSGAQTVSGGSGSGYVFYIASGTMPGGLILNTSTGRVSGTPIAAGSFTIGVRDSKGAVATGTCPIVINLPLSLLCPTNTGKLGSSYNSSAAVSGGVPPYTFSIAVGTLPPGLTLNPSTGAVTGTPNTPGTFGFTIQVKDALGAVAFSACSQGCTAGTVTWDFSTVTGPLATSQSYTVGGISITAYGYTTANAPSNLYGKHNGGDENGLGLVTDSGNDHEIDTAHYIQLDFSQVIAAGATNAQIVVASIQSGESFNLYGSNTLGSIGTLLYSGTASQDNVPFAIPSFPNYKYIAVKATANNVVLGAVTFTLGKCAITIARPPALTLACPTGTAKVGSSYNSNAVPSGGLPPYTFSIGSGALPTGLTLNSSTGAITGTPTTAGPFSFSIKVTDSLGTTALSSCSGSCGGGAVWNFATKLGNLGNSATFTVNGLSITAYGYTTGNVASALYGKNDGGDEEGLGLVTDSGNDHEIDTGHYIQLDLSNLFAAGATNATMVAGSIQSGESFNLYGSNTLGSIGTLLLSNQAGDLKPFAVPSFGTYRYVSMKAAYANVLLSALSVTLGNCQIVVSSSAAGAYTTYTMGGWGSPPNGNNPGMILTNNFGKVYPGGSITIGGSPYFLKFTSAAAIISFLPYGTTPGILTSSGTNPSSTAAGVFASQVLALQLNVDFSEAGILKVGFPELTMSSGPLQGYTVQEVLSVANAVLAGNASMLPSGMSVSNLNDLVTSLNGNFDNGTVNNGVVN